MCQFLRFMPNLKIPPTVLGPSEKGHVHCQKHATDEGLPQNGAVLGCFKGTQSAVGVKPNTYLDSAETEDSRYYNCEAHKSCFLKTVIFTFIFKMRQSILGSGQ